MHPDTETQYADAFFRLLIMLGEQNIPLQISKMKKYKASQAPDPKEWLSLDEYNRLELVVEFVNEFETHIEDTAKRIHAGLHVIVENQLAMESAPTPETYSRLRKQGLNRHEAIHAIGAVISEDMFEIMQGNRQELKYQDRLRKLTAKKWKKGKW
jgi:hypothetical protein